MTAVAHRRGFTLTELLVAVAIILMLMVLITGAVSAARGSQRKQVTQALIAEIDSIIQQQYATYATRPVPGDAGSALAAASRRQMVTGDMPNNWSEVQALKTGTVGLASSSSRKFPLNAAQRAYVQYRDSITPPPTSQFEDAECLFMIVMLGGFADCIDCSGFSVSEIGDKDGDSAPEFLDAWKNPIGFILWPAGLELPSGQSRYFSTTAPFSSGTMAPAPGGTMRPLIYSRGPDGGATFAVPQTAQITTGTNCGNPAHATVATFGAFSAPAEDPVDRRSDNLTNFDTEVGR